MGLTGSLSPSVWQQFFKLFDRMVGDAAENIAEPGKRIDLDEFAGGDEAVQNRRRPAAVVGSRILKFPFPDP